MSDYLQLSGRTVLVFGVANRKSVAWFVARSLEEAGARVLYSVRSEARRKSLEAQLAGKPVFVCDVEQENAPAGMPRKSRSRRRPQSRPRSPSAC
mgnify:CR=1 FL=1